VSDLRAVSVEEHSLERRVLWSSVYAGLSMAIRYGVFSLRVISSVKKEEDVSNVGFIKKEATPHNKGRNVVVVTEFSPTYENFLFLPPRWLLQTLKFLFLPLRWLLQTLN
jgi:hypothetical protein